MRRLREPDPFSVMFLFESKGGSFSLEFALIRCLLPWL